MNNSLSIFLSLWETIFKRPYSRRVWKQAFGVDVEVVAYIWDRYASRASIRQPKHLLMILYFLKTYGLCFILASRFNECVSSMHRIVFDGIQSLAVVMEEVDFGVID